MKILIINFTIVPKREKLKPKKKMTSENQNKIDELNKEIEDIKEQKICLGKSLTKCKGSFLGLMY